MNATAASKTHAANLLEGMTLSAIFVAFPNFAGAAMLLKLFGSDIVGRPGGAVIFVVMATLFYAPLTAFYGPRFPKIFKSRYEPLFFDATLLSREKILRWRLQPATSLELMTTALMLSVLAVAVMSVG
jgi:hypothetical protein